MEIREQVNLMLFANSIPKNSVCGVSRGNDGSLSVSWKTAQMRESREIQMSFGTVEVNDLAEKYLTAANPDAKTNTPKITQAPAPSINAHIVEPT